MPEERQGESQHALLNGKRKIRNLTVLSFLPLHCLLIGNIDFHLEGRSYVELKLVNDIDLVLSCSICEMNIIWCCFCFLRHYLKVSNNELWGYWRSLPSLQKKLQLQDVPSYAYAQEFKSWRSKTFSFHLKVFIHLLYILDASSCNIFYLCFDRMLLKSVKLKRLTSSSICFLF